MNSSPMRPTILALGVSFLALPTVVLANTDADTGSGSDAGGDAEIAASMGTLDAATFTLAASVEGSEAVASAKLAQAQGQTLQVQSQNAVASGPPPSEIPTGVFDETWVAVGIGAGLVPSYGGSDDYVLFPLPLIVGRVGGVGISPNGAGLTLDLNSASPGAAQQTTRVSFGPAFRIRNDRSARIKDEVVKQLEDLDIAIELGGNIGITFPGVLNPFDAVTLSTQVRKDILGAHDGVLVEPSIGYRTPLSRASIIQITAGLQFVDDNFASYYYTVTPAQSAASGLPVFTAEGGLNSIGTTAIMNYDLDGDALNGGFNVFGIFGYSRLMGDAADTPFTAIRGSADQFIGGLGIAYTF